jgi:predicted TIM-barrel fold metal-dependent hydrolase
MMFDSHAHLFSPAVIAKVSTLNGLAENLCLNVDAARGRTDKIVLKREFGAAGIQGCLLLPTAPVNGVHKANDLFLRTVEGEVNLFTAGTLHPSCPGIDQELEWLSSHGVRALKLCSFSQGFDLESDEAFRLFESIRAHNISGRARFFIILDTFYEADIYFGAPKAHLTTPAKLGRLVSDFPEIDFVGAHMGGLCAPSREIREHLVPRQNLYLDTSNAAHVLSREEFIGMLQLHGPGHILFGTDWPWFGHEEEVRRIEDLLQQAGFSSQERSGIFSGNISRLLGIEVRGRKSEVLTSDL